MFTAVVVEAAEAEPGEFGDLREEMDTTGKVDPAYQKLKVRKGTAAKPAKKTSSKPKATSDTVNAGAATLTLTKPVSDIAALAKQLTQFLGGDVCQELGRAWGMQLVEMKPKAAKSRGSCAPAAPRRRRSGSESRPLCNLIDP